jgi:putative acetyltransferase
MSLRCYLLTDLPAIIKLSHDTVHTINAQDYAPEELAVWAPENADTEKWALSLAKNYTIVAEHSGIIVGFGDLTAAGIIDHLYVHKDYQARGFGYRILLALIEEAQRRRLPEITSAVSITALPFVLKLGAEIVEKQTVMRNGIALTNFLVRKKLHTH